MSDLITRDEELVQLRAENARIDEESVLLRAENARLRHQEEAQVAWCASCAPETRAIMPNDVEMRELLDAVNSTGRAISRRSSRDEFARAFRALGTIHRQAGLRLQPQPGSLGSPRERASVMAWRAQFATGSSWPP